MKKWKGLAAFLLALAMSFSLMACGGSDGGTDTIPESIENLLLTILSNTITAIFLGHGWEKMAAY